MRKTKNILKDFTWQEIFIYPDEDRFYKRINHFIGFKTTDEQTESLTIFEEQNWAALFKSLNFADDSVVFHIACHDNIIEETIFLEFLSEVNFIRKLKSFTRKPAKEGGMSTFGCVSKKENKVFQFTIDPCSGVHCAKLY